MRSGPGVLGIAMIRRAHARSLSGIDRSIAANDPQPSASFSARKNPQRIPANTPPVFPGLRPCIWPHLLRLVTKAMPNRLLAYGNSSSVTIESYTEFMATSSGSQPSPMQAETCSENSRQPRGISTRQTLGSPWARTSWVTRVSRILNSNEEETQARRRLVARV